MLARARDYSPLA